MADLWRRFEHEHFKPLLRKLKPWQSKTFGGIKVNYMKHLDGGGSAFGQDYVPLLREWRVPRQQRVFEWCSGPAFIGFSLLGHELCRTLCLADINPDAIEACRRTIRSNRLTDRVAVYHSDNLASIPSSERWDLVVGNPPHFVDAFVGELRSYDPEWRIHRSFFEAVEPHLNPGAVIVLQENNSGSTAETFRPMIEAAGLSMIFVHGCAGQRTRDHHIYYIGIMRPGDAPPEWARRLMSTR